MTKLTKLRNVKASFIGKFEIKNFWVKIIPVKEGHACIFILFHAAKNIFYIELNENCNQKTFMPPFSFNFGGKLNSKPNFIYILLFSWRVAPADQDLCMHG